MNLAQSILFFGLPGFVILVALYFGVPIATSLGIPLIVSWTAGLWLPIILLLCWVLVRHFRNPKSDEFKERFRLKKLQRGDWIAIAVAFVAVQVCEISLSRTGAIISEMWFFSTPSVIPELFDPGLDIEAGLSTFFAVPVEGNWWLLVFWLGWLVINIGGEELLWRGYALPLQERVFGGYAWLVNGLCWNLLVHAFMRWNFLTLMPVSLVIPYLVQHRKNTWIGIYLHGLGNALVLLILVPSIAGWI
ncbi:CPBP family intramembrane glutamic endopeptidase [Yoonia sp. BS5-3]|uniref:Type II CAAX prenyl endopeptidase Rce1 family protein n=1 Tax=Yoonia phaeophyticola TaxID=3137369 RepID=A0ABZ2V042_9RHOB